MKVAVLILFLLIPFSYAFASDDGEVLKFKAKVGFTNAEDSIVGYNILENGKKLLLIGKNSIQIWDVENAKLVSSMPHQIPQFAPKGFFNTYILLGLPQILAWKPYVVDPNGKWIITVEKIGDKELKSAVVRDLQTLKQIAVLDLPNVSTDYILLDEAENEIKTFGQTNKIASFADWDKETLRIKKNYSINEHKWHQLIKNEEKMLIGSGDTATSWNIWDSKQGNRLTLRDVETGEIEKEFTAKDLTPKSSYQKTIVSADEKFLVSERNDRFFVWEIAGDGSPRFEIAKRPKEDFAFEGFIGGRFLAISIDKKLQIYDFAGNGSPKYVLSSGNANDSVRIQDRTKDGKYIAVADDRKLSVLETDGNGKPLYEIVRENEKERFTTVKFLDDEKYFVVGRINRSEKKPERTQLYELETGKVMFEIPLAFGSDLRFTPDKNLLFSENLGSASVWNFMLKKSFSIPLAVYYPSNSSDSMTVTTEYPYNVEYTLFSPNNKQILKYGDDFVSVFDVEKGEIIQQLFDAETVKYNKQNKIKKSGLGNAGWTENGKFVYALDNKSRTVSFWEMTK